MAQQVETYVCPACGGRLVRAGFARGRQRFQCVSCARTTTQPTIFAAVIPSEQGRRPSLEEFRDLQLTMARTLSTACEQWVLTFKVTRRGAEVLRGQWQPITDLVAEAIGKLGGGSHLISATLDPTNTVATFLCLLRPEASAVIEAQSALGRIFSDYGLITEFSTLYNLQDQQYYTLGPGGPTTAVLQVAGQAVPYFDEGASDIYFKDRARVRV